MSVIVPARSIEALSMATDPRQAIMEIVAPALPKIEVLFNYVLVATYIRPEKTKGGIIRPTNNVAEDQWQGKVGLVLKLGTHAFVDDGDNAFNGIRVEVGDWAGYKVGDAWEVLVNGTQPISCRMVRDSSIRFKVTDPEVVL